MQKNNGSWFPSLPDRDRDPRRYHRHQRWLISGGLVDLLGGPVDPVDFCLLFLGALPVMAKDATSASGETPKIAVRPASEASSNASRAAWSLLDLTDQGYGATDAALALLASDWDLNAAAALLESRALTPLDLLRLASDKLTQSANPAPPQEAPGAASGALTAPMCSCGRTCKGSGKGWATHCCSQCTRGTHTDHCEKRHRLRRVRTDEE